MSDTTTTAGCGVTPAFILFIVFLILKLTGQIDWSWWWVTCPLWAGFAIIIGIVAIMAIFGTLGAIFKNN